MKRYLLLMLPLALAACTQPATEQTTAPVEATAPAAPALDAASLSSHYWQLADAKAADGTRIDALFVQADKPVQLEFVEGRLAISNTCNRQSAGFTVEGDKLTVSPAASTMMACPDPKLMALDQEVSKRLEGTSTAALQSGDAAQLTLTNAAGDVLTFKGVPTPATRFGGPGERMFFEVAAQTLPCNHPLIPDKQCVQVREIKFDEQGLRAGEPGEWQPLFQDIEGFTHTPGTRNVVRVNRYTVANPPADGSSVAYVLDMVVESEVVKP